MNISLNGVRVLQYFESCRLQAYPDPGTGGAPWTIGWGHTGPDVVPGLRWDQPTADAQLLIDLRQFERAVEAACTRPLRQGQFDALVCLTYNIGAGALATSTLLRLLNAGDFKGARGQFARWTRAGGQVMRGLVRRRAAEQALWDDFTAAAAIEAGRAAA